jgi:TatD DNase family protein
MAGWHDRPMTRFPMFIDSHAHIEGTQFAQDRDAMLERARSAGLTTLLAIGNGDGPGTGTLDCAVKFADQYDWIYATTGIHPHEARLATQADYDEMQRLVLHPKLLAWGEIGLDYWYEHSPRDVQQRVFVDQMEMAAAAKKPIIIHCRPSQNGHDAWDDCLLLLRQHWQSTGLRGVMHCFTGELEHANASLDLGFNLSFAGNLTYPKAQNIRDVAKMVPADRYFIETDCPYLAPIPLRGKRNEPAFVVETAKSIGELRGLSREEVGAETSDNFRSFFGLKGENVR